MAKFFEKIKGQAGNKGNTHQTPVPMNKADSLSENRLFSEELLKRTLGSSFNNILTNPDKIIRKAGIYDEWNFYEEILIDDMVSTCLNKILRGVSCLKWEIYQGPADDKIFEVINNVFLRLNSRGLVRNAIKNIIKTLAYGRNFINPIWEFADGIQQPVNLVVYPLQCFSYDYNGNIKLLDDSTSLYEKECPPYSVINPRINPTVKNPFGESMLSKCYWLTFFKKNAMQFMNVFLEKFDMPWIVSHYDSQVLNQMFPDTKNPEDKAQALVNLLKLLGQDAILAMPEGIKMEVLNMVGAAQSTSNYKVVIDLCNEGISRIWTGHTSTTIATPGKLGDDKTANDEFQNVINDAKEMVVEAMNQLISWICEINYNNAVAPEFRFYIEKDINKDLADRDKILFDQGIRPNKTYYSREYSIPEDEFEIVDTADSGLTATAMNKLIEPFVDEIRTGTEYDFDSLKTAIKEKLPGTTDLTVEKIMGKIIEKI